MRRGRREVREAAFITLIAFLIFGWYVLVTRLDSPPTQAVPEPKAAAVSSRGGSFSSAPATAQTTAQISVRYVSQRKIDYLLRSHPARCYSTGKNTVTYDDWHCVKISDDEWRCDRF